MKVACCLKLTTDKVLVFHWIAGSCQVNLLKTGRIVRKPVNANSGLTFSSMQMFLAALFCLYADPGPRATLLGWPKSIY